MKPKKWLFLFFTLGFIFVLVVGIFNLVVDPYNVFRTPIGVNFTSDRNARFAKLKKLQLNDSVETLIVGSSRSEYVFPEDMKAKSFSTSIGGAMTYTRYAYVMKSLEMLKNLKEIWYFSDLYEFNKKDIPWKLGSLKEFEKYFGDKIFDPVRHNSFLKVKSLISLSSLRASIKTLKEIRKGKNIIYLNNGRTTRSATMSSSSEFNQRLRRSLNQYRYQEWSEFNELSGISQQMFYRMSSLARGRGVKLRITLTPFHPYISEYIQKEPKLLELFSDWKAFMQTLSNLNGVEVIDLEQEEVFADTSDFWQDGVHFNRKASQKVIEFIEK